MKQPTDNKDIEEFTKWSKIFTIATMAFGGLWIGRLMLTILREFTDLEEKAPFLYGKIFAGILFAVVLVLVALHVFCYVKMRKYKKLIEEIANEVSDDETNER